jgi:hypothetical protein
MLDEKTSSRFRWFKVLPRGVSAGSRFRALFFWIRDYLSYNRTQVNLPTVWKSPGGSHRRRVSNTVLLLVMLSMSIYLFAFHSVVSFGEHTIRVRSTNGTPWLMGVHLLLCPVAALCVWTFALFAFTWRFIGRAHALKKIQVSPSHWYRMQNRMANSVNPVERESLWLGRVAADGSPILWPVEALDRHSIVTGGTGSGKSALLMSLVDQLIYRTDRQLIIVDCKAETYELLATLKRAAALKGKQTGTTPAVKHFTLEKGRCSHLVDVLGMTRHLPTPQRCGVMLSSLALAHAQEYGQSFFRDQSFEFLSFVLERHPDVENWGELVQHMQDAIRFASEIELSKRTREYGDHVLLVAKRLASLDALNSSSRLPQSVLDNAIDFTNEHIYFDLSAKKNGFIAGEVARLIAGLLKTLPRKRRILIIDEFQIAVNKELELFLTQARSHGIGVVLACQNASQLVTSDWDGRPVIEANTALQMWMTANDVVGREQLRQLGGIRREPTINKHQNSRGELSYTFGETITDRISPNLIDEVSSHPKHYFARLIGDAGYAAYGGKIFVGESMFHQTKQNYDRAMKTPWPGPSANTLVNQNALPQVSSQRNRAQSVAPQIQPQAQQAVQRTRQRTRTRRAAP